MLGALILESERLNMGDVFNFHDGTNLLVVILGPVSVEELVLGLIENVFGVA